MTTSSYARAGLLSAAAGLGALALSACGSSSPAASPTSTTATTSAAVTTSAPATTASAQATTVAASSAPAASVATDRANALAAWKKGAEVSSAELNVSLKQAASDLTAAKAAGADASTYGAAIAELDQLQTIPETDVTAAQRATAQKDVTALDAFFGTPGLYS